MSPRADYEHVLELEFLDLDLINLCGIGMDTDKMRLTHMSAVVAL